MFTLFPPIEPYQVHRLQVDSLHTLHVEQSGNPAGIPILFVHGGPGTGSNENHRRYFDPARYHIINFDQRGCNRSLPSGTTDNNTTADLIGDIERIREHLRIRQWVIFGGSWGATLGLLYAERHPERILAMILRGVFLARQSDSDWFFRSGGVGRILPDAWEQFQDFIDRDRRHNLVEAYYEHVHGQDVIKCKAAAAQWVTWTGRVVGWTLDSTGFNFAADIERVVNEARIETHYAKHDYFIAADQILMGIRAIPRVPLVIIHGRRDLTCTLDASWLLHRNLPGSELHIVREGGHLASEPVMIDALIQATNALITKLSG